MRTSLEGKTAIVTGATSGIGAATAERLIGLGARVIGTGRRYERLEEMRSLLGEDFRHARLDMTDPAAVRRFAEDLTAAPDILVNNAGLALGLSGAHEASLEDWERMIDTNIRGLVHLTRALLPEMKRLPRADIVNISSVAGSYPYPGANVYGATKAFVTQFSLNLRADLAGSKVRVSSVEPGLTETEFSEVRFGGDKEKASKVYENTESLTADDIALVITDLLTLPPHVNINRVEIMPVCQTFGGFEISRNC
jgi:NADP-dependent 3-hydroxy acid dehydrogenase YdfG